MIRCHHVGVVTRLKFLFSDNVGSGIGQTVDGILVVSNFSGNTVVGIIEDVNGEQ
jgi:hypothetical protein